MNNFRYNFNPQGSGFRSPGRQSPFDGIRKFFTGRTVLSRLIIANLAVFVGLGLVRLVFYLYNLDYYYDAGHHISRVSHWLAVPSGLLPLAERPWTVLTYMFLHEDFWHLFLNMLMLYFGGLIFTEYLGGRKLLLVYLLGGVSGAVFYIAAFNLFPVFEPVVAGSLALGASASVLAIIVAIATYVPDYTVHLFLFGKIKFKWVAVVFVVLDVLSIQKGNAGGHIAHLGGAFFGFVYILSLKKGLIVNQLGQPFGRLFRKKPKMKASYSRRPVTDDEYSYQKVTHQKRIDDILDKIKRSGYESLSKEEKEYLFRDSKKP